MKLNQEIDLGQSSHCKNIYIFDEIKYIDRFKTRLT